MTYLGSVVKVCVLPSYSKLPSHQGAILDKEPHAMVKEVGYAPFSLVDRDRRKGAPHRRWEECILH